MIRDEAAAWEPAQAAGLGPGVVGARNAHDSTAATPPCAQLGVNNNTAC